jgi:dienelactone hydrolase
LVLSACGAHGAHPLGSSGRSSGGGGTAARGTLLQNPPALATTVTAATLAAELTADEGSGGQLILQQVLTLAGVPQCDINVYHLEYATVGARNESTTASSALMVPSGSGAACSGPRPIVLYAHGTSATKTYNIADVSNQRNAEGILLAAFFAARGDIVVAPNYAGYDTSTLSYHPFLVGDQQSKDMIDALSAARAALPTSASPHTTDNGRLFITGYSQGGYVALATHRAMQAANMTVTASAPMSGPYALAAFVDSEFEGEVSGGAPVVATLMLDAYQNSYGNIFVNAADIINSKYAAGFESLLPSTMPRSELYSQGKLPQWALFDPTPPAPSYASITPATTPAALGPVFALGFGADKLIINSYRLSYLQDAQANPDGGFPNLTDNLPPATPTLAWRQALKLNDLRNWTPTAPTLLCGGDQDPTVYFFNAQLMQSYVASHSPASPLQVLDLDSSVSAGGVEGSLQAEFQAAKAALLLSGGIAAVFNAYHDSLVPPFCLAAAISFFNAL